MRQLKSIISFDVLASLKAGKEVIISKSFALGNGYCLPGHEVKIKAFQYLASTQPNTPMALYFGMADSDDDAKGLQRRRFMAMLSLTAFWS